MTTRRLLITIAILLTAATARADDWPAYRHDNRRSGSTTETLGLPLKQIWRYDSPSPPKPAWAGPAKWDAFAGKPGMKNMRDFDSVFHVTIAGDRVFFGSSADDAAHCLDSATGKTKWISHTDGPVRLPPAIAGGNAYFGSDDGYAYCVKVSDGSGVWKYHAAPSDRLVPSNGKLISLWPCRTGVLVSDGKAYFAGSLLPWRKSQFCAVDAQTGKDSGPGLFKTISSGEAMQGAPLASDTHIFVPQGRSVACVFSRSNGKFAYYLGQRRDGGVHATLMNSSHLILGPGSSTGWLSMMDIKTRKRINLFRGANRIAIGEKTGYIYKPGNLSAVKLGKQIKIREQIGKLTDKNRKLGRELKKLSNPPKGKKETPAQTDKRKKDQEKIKSEQKANSLEIKRLQKDAGACVGWNVKCPIAYEIILAGEIVFLGGDSSVYAMSARGGKQLWKAQVDGKAHGLAVANGRLYVSTTKGKIHCFAAAKPKAKDKPADGL